MGWEYLEHYSYIDQEVESYPMTSFVPLGIHFTSLSLRSISHQSKEKTGFRSYSAAPMTPGAIPWVSWKTIINHEQVHVGADNNGRNGNSALILFQNNSFQPQLRKPSKLPVWDAGLFEEEQRQKPITPLAWKPDSTTYVQSLPVCLFKRWSIQLSTGEHNR